MQKSHAKYDEVIIKKLSTEHKEDWIRLWNRYLDFYNTSVEESVYEYSFERITDENNKECDGFIAFINDEAVGIVNCIYHMHFWYKKPMCYLQDLFVSSEHRNDGIGRKLILKVYDHADQKGMQSVYWLTQDFNSDARKLYDKIGSVTPFIKYVKA